ncbi:MAG: type II secretion system F family protein [Promethearchaeota archaeon]
MKYLYRDSFSAFQIAGGAIIGSMLVLILSTAVFSIFLNLISAFILGLSSAMMVLLIIPSGVLSRYANEIVRIERVTPYVLEELATVYLTTKSVFEAISYVSRGSYAVVSSEFSRMIDRFNFGHSPEQLLEEFAVNQPSVTLKRGLLAFVNFVESSSSGLDTVINDSHENLQRRFEQVTLQWESRMMVFSGVLVFLPLIIVLGLAVRGLATNPIILLLPVIQYGLSSLMRRMMLPFNEILIGE